MGLFKNKYEKNLDALIDKINVNMSNNYKDAAQDNFKEFEASFDKYRNEGLIKGKSLEEYNKKALELREKLAGFTHKDQKPYWT